MNSKPKLVMGKQTTGNGRREYDHSHNSFHKAIGISNERRDELLDILAVLFMATGKKSETFEALHQTSDDLVTPTEKSYLAYMMGIIAYDNGDITVTRHGGQTPWLN